MGLKTWVKGSNMYQEVIDCPDWMLTMGDCMSLLMCFFVLLLTFTTPEKAKLMNIMGGIKGALSAVPVLHTPRDIPSVYKESEDEEDAVDEKVTDGIKKKKKIKKDVATQVNLKKIDIVNAFHEYKDVLKSLGFKNKVTMKQVDEGIVLKIMVSELYLIGRKDINVDRAKVILQGFVNLLNMARTNEVKLVANYTLSSFSRSGSTPELMTSNFEKLKNLANFMTVNYKIPKKRFSYGCKALKIGQEEFISIILTEKHDVSEFTIDDLIKMKESL